MPLLRWLPIVLWVFVISFLSFSSLKSVPLPSFIGWDKVGHFGMYFVLEFLLLIPLNNQKKGLLVWSFIAIGYSGLTEIIQHCFIENRYGEWMDFVANFLGILFAFMLLKSRFKKLT